MYVRLAFAVAAHLEPEILLVDEVLAVGDINFQKKCLGKMGDVARAGRTVVLVSHQLNQIRRLCHRVVWIDAGQVRQEGPSHVVVSAYESNMRSDDETPADRNDNAIYKARFVGWEIEGASRASPHCLGSLGPVTVRFLLDVAEPIRRGIHGIALYNMERQLIWGNASHELTLEPGISHFTYDFDSLPLRPGPYSWLVSLFDDSGQLDMWDAVPEMILMTESHQHPLDEWTGVLNLPSKFTVQPLGQAPSDVSRTTFVRE
jgi:hypothetical protein